MEQHTIDVINACAHGAHTGTMNFPTIVKELLGAGVTRYHVDFQRAESTYYLPSGASQIVPLPLPDETIAQEFNSQAVASAVLASQQEGQPFPQFLVRAMQAGCVGYIAYLEGERVVYGGRLGDMHIEYFPGSHFQSNSNTQQK